MAFFALFGAIGAFAAALGGLVARRPSRSRSRGGGRRRARDLAVRPMVSKALHRRHEGHVGRGVHGTLVGEEVLTLDVVGDARPARVTCAWPASAGWRSAARSSPSRRAPASWSPRCEGTTLTVWPIDGPSADLDDRRRPSEPRPTGPKESNHDLAALSAVTIVGLVVAVLIVDPACSPRCAQSVNIVQQGQVGVVKRLGEYRKTHEPGLVIILPFVDSLQRVDMREIPVPGDRQDVITKDNVVVTVNATIFTQVVDAKQALFSVKNFDIAIDALARTALRSVIGTMTLDEALSERERINTDVQQQMEVVTDKWGIRISRIEIVEIAPPPQILQALALQKQADQEKRARILQSEGQQQSAINIAEGDAQAAVRAAQGERQAAILRAEGNRAGRDPRGRGSRRRPSPPSTAPSRRPNPTRRWWPSCSSTRSAGSPTATTPRSSCRSRAPACWARPRPSAASSGAAGHRRREPAGAVTIAGATVAHRQGRGAVQEAQGPDDRRPPARLERLPRQPRGRPA